MWRRQHKMLLDCKSIGSFGTSVKQEYIIALIYVFHIVEFMIGMNHCGCTNITPVRSSNL